MNKLSDPELDDLLRRALGGPVADDFFGAGGSQRLPPSGRVGIWLPAMATGGELAGMVFIAAVGTLAARDERMGHGQHGASSATMCAVLFSMGLLGCIWALDEAA